MTLEEIFGVKKPVIGVVHVAYIDPLQALVDARNLHLDGGGVDALLVENWGESSRNPFVAEETVKRMSSVIEAIINEIDTVIGVNVLHNDYRAAFRIARAQGLSFVQLNVYSDHARTAYSTGVQFDVVVDPADVQRHRQGTSAALFVNIHSKNYKPLTAESWEEYEPITDSARRAIDLGADGVVVTNTTGAVPDLEKIIAVREFADSYMRGFPVLVRGRATKENISDVLKYADGVIVGTALKFDGVTCNLVDPVRVEEYMEAVDHFRQQQHI